MYTQDQLLAIARLALMSYDEAKNGIDGMDELDFCESAGIEDEYYNLEDWRELFIKNYSRRTQGAAELATPSNSDESAQNANPLT
jgi:hypothetical protein